MNYDLLKSQINSIVSLNNEEWHRLLPFIESRNFKKTVILYRKVRYVNQYRFAGPFCHRAVCKNASGIP
jgi:hypothetical protein